MDLTERDPHCAVENNSATRTSKKNNSNNLYASRLQRRCRSRSFVRMN